PGTPDRPGGRTRGRRAARPPGRAAAAGPPLPVRGPRPAAAAGPPPQLRDRTAIGSGADRAGSGLCTFRRMDPAADPSRTEVPEPVDPGPDVEVTMLLADAAQVADGKLYVLGGGLSS